MNESVFPTFAQPPDMANWERLHREMFIEICRTMAIPPTQFHPLPRRGITINDIITALEEYCAENGEETK